MIFALAMGLILLFIFMGVSIPLSFLSGSFFLAIFAGARTGSFATNAYYMLEGIEPCIGVTTTAIKDTLNDSQPIPVTIEKILNEVARTYNVMPADIRGKKRNANVSAARQMTMYIIREVTGMSMEAIGQEFQRDHSTVVYSIKTMEENIKRDQHLKEMCSDIMKNVRT